MAFIYEDTTKEQTMRHIYLLSCTLYNCDAGPRMQLAEDAIHWRTLTLTSLNL
jgi:hypothetical protein